MPLRHLLSSLAALLAVAVLHIVLPHTAAAQPAADHCIALAQGPTLSGPIIHAASRKLVALDPTEVRLTFVGHATWLIESPGGIRIATDYNDYIRPEVVPDIATMNRAHTTHYSLVPDPAIKHLLRGWDPAGAGPAKHDLSLGDVRVRNVATNTRDWAGGHIPHGNSVFIFELAGLCIGHLGHLHHTLTEEQLGWIGQLDVVMVAVDGSYTLDIAGVVETLKALKARLVLPMHYFENGTLQRFLGRLGNDFAVETSATSSVVISQATLPKEPKVLVLPGR